MLDPEGKSGKSGESILVGWSEPLKWDTIIAGQGESKEEATSQIASGGIRQTTDKTCGPAAAPLWETCNYKFVVTIRHFALPAPK
jgi:hypothetical protein